MLRVPDEPAVRLWKTEAAVSDFAWMSLLAIIIAVGVYATDIIRAWRKP